MASPPSFARQSFARLRFPLTALAFAAALSGCAVGPDYHPVALDLPTAYKEDGPWKPAQPQAVDTHQAWWDAYGDTVLAGLIHDADSANQTLQQAEAQYRQAQALADVSRAGLSPTVGANVGTTRARTVTNGIKLGSTDVVGLSASWVPDLWGGVRRGIEAGDAGAQASADDLAAARLSIRATLAQDYLQLRVIDLLRDLYADTIAAYTRSAELSRHQFEAGIVLRSDVALAQSQLKTAQAQDTDLQAQRAQLEHAIAVLTGRAPATFSLAPTKQSAQQLLAQLPVAPAGLPSTLLERRPDIAAAERRVAQANANIGVARAAYYPNLTLSATAGFGAAAWGSLLDSPSRVWSLGAVLAETLFDGGLRQARNAQAEAAYDVAAAQYKQTVLNSFQQVEDNLALLRLLEQEAAQQAEAVEAAQLAESLALRQYQAGTANVLTVVTAQALTLTNQRAAAQLLGRRLTASVALITATGGGWEGANSATSTSATKPATASSGT